MKNRDDAATTDSDTPSSDSTCFWLIPGRVDDLRELEEGLIGPPYADTAEHRHVAGLTYSRASDVPLPDERARRFACRVALFNELVEVPANLRRATEQAFDRISDLRDRVSPRHWDRLRSIALSQRMRELRKEIYDAQGN